VICEDVSLREIARSTGEGDGGAGKRRTIKRVITAVDQLARHFGEGRVRLRAEGELPGAFVGEVSTRRAFR
jgi:hypothetical protein